MLFSVGMKGYYKKWVGFLLLIVECSYAATRIIGGVRTSIAQYPYVCSLQADDAHVCGAAIIAENVIVSAAHCIRFKPDAYTVRVGSTYSNEGGTVHQVSDIKLHPNYDRDTSDSDFCLIFLSKNITFSRKATKIALPLATDTYPDYLVTSVMGWGTTKVTDYNEVSPILKQVNLPLVALNRCKPMFPPFCVTDNMLCALSSKNEDSCTGDSGGPMVANAKLIGVVSWSFGCATSTPGVYTDVAKMIPFVQKYVHT